MSKNAKKTGAKGAHDPALTIFTMSLAELDEPLGALSHKVSDTALDLGEKTRPVLLALHEIVKPLARRRPELTSSYSCRLVDQSAPRHAR